MFPDEHEDEQKPCEIIETSNTVIHKCPRPRPFAHTLLIKSVASKCCPTEEDISCGWAIVHPLEDEDADDTASPSYCWDSSPSAAGPSGYNSQSAMEASNTSIEGRSRPETSCSYQEKGLAGPVVAVSEKSVSTV